jgi:hypothetical protein
MPIVSDKDIMHVYVMEYGCFLYIEFNKNLDN